MSVVTIFGSSQAKEDEKDYETGKLLGRELAEAGHTVCNGGYSGIMEATARGAKEASGKTIGVTTEDFGGPANRWVDQEIKMKRWSDRLFKLIELGDAYVVFNGGTGTLVELFVVWEMLNKQFIHKPVIVFGKKFRELVKRIQKFPHVITTRSILFADSPVRVISLLKKLNSSLVSSKMEIVYNSRREGFVDALDQPMIMRRIYGQNG